MAKRAKNTKAPKGARAARGKQAPTASDAWWDHAEEVPRAGIPATDTLNKRTKRLRRIVWATVFLTPLSLFVTFLAVAQTLGEPAETETVTTDAYADTKPRATVAVRDWLNDDPAPVPGGQFVGWHSATSETHEETDTNGDTTTYVVETHRLVVGDTVENLYDVYVSLGIRDNLSPVVIDAPNLIPRLPSEERWDGPLWPGLEQGAVTPELESAAAAWANAYSSGDSAALRLAIGDDNASRHYVPLPGGVLTEPSVTAVAPLWDEDTEPADRDGMSTTAVMRATFYITWPDPEGGQEDLEGAPVTYDLLVHKANTAAPVVVAWGGAGSGASLKPYSNSVAAEVALAPAATASPDIDEDDQ